ncbi:MAG: hypothetical protein KBC34_05665 [Phenylobacterium sp.]|nr:hypothetical protein [Phenylobacterium sp.]
MATYSVKVVLLTPLDLSTALKWKGREPAPETTPKPGGTRVQMRGYDIVENGLGVRLPKVVERILPDHTYVQYEDGRDTIVAKGGPTKSIFSGEGLWQGGTGQLKVVSEVRPASRSDDYRRGTKLIAETVVPGKSAKEVARPAQAHSAQVNRGGNLYGGNVNSNSFAGDAYERSTGRRPATPPDAWGSRTRLGGGQMSPQLQRARKLLGTGLGSTALGLAITGVAEDMGKRLGGRSLYGY